MQPSLSEPCSSNIMVKRQKRQGTLTKSPGSSNTKGFQAPYTIRTSGLDRLDPGIEHQWVGTSCYGRSGDAKPNFHDSIANVSVTFNIWWEYAINFPAKVPLWNICFRLIIGFCTFYRWNLHFSDLCCIHFFQIKLPWLETTKSLFYLFENNLCKVPLW